MLCHEILPRLLKSNAYGAAHNTVAGPSPTHPTASQGLGLMTGRYFNTKHRQHPLLSTTVLTQPMSIMHDCVCVSRRLRLAQCPVPRGTSQHESILTNRSPSPRLQPREQGGGTLDCLHDPTPTPSGEHWLCTTVVQCDKANQRGVTVGPSRSWSEYCAMSPTLSLRYLRYLQKGAEPQTMILICMAG